MVHSSKDPVPENLMLMHISELGDERYTLGPLNNMDKVKIIKYTLFCMLICAYHQKMLFLMRAIFSVYLARVTPRKVPSP